MFSLRKLQILASGLFLACQGGQGIAAPVEVLNGPGVAPMQDALQRIGWEFRSIDELGEAALDGSRVLVLCGSAPPVAPAQLPAVRKFLEGGGSILAVGGGARWAIENGLVDGSGYYPTGSTIHQTSFEGIHPLVAGYPGEKPEQGWTRGVPMLFRTTGGPLMELGPSASSILSYGPPYSAAALQPVGKGVILLIGPDPQGGDVYYSLEEATPLTGEEHGTDRLLANAVQWLVNRSDANLLPGFEEEFAASTEYSGWAPNARRGGEWRWKDNSYLELSGSGPDSVAQLRPGARIVIEGGQRYELKLRYKSTARWSIRPTLHRGQRPGLEREVLPTVWVEPSEAWTEVSESIEIPARTNYLTFSLMLIGEGSLSLDDVSLSLAGSRSCPPAF